MKRNPECVMECAPADHPDDIFIVLDGVRIAKRGHPGTPQAMTWVSLEPGWTVRDENNRRDLVIECNGVRVQ